MSTAYPGPSPAAISDIAPNYEKWSYDIFEYQDELADDRHASLAIFIKPVGHDWQLGHGFFDLMRSTTKTLVLPGQAPEWATFSEAVAKYGAKGLFEAYLPIARAWLNARYGGPPQTPADLQFTQDRQSVASAIYDYKPRADHLSVLPKQTT